MINKDVVQAALEAIDKPEMETMCYPPASECCCPQKVIYLIFTECVTINNGACPDWAICGDSSPRETQKLAQG